MSVFISYIDTAKSNLDSHTAKFYSRFYPVN